MYTHQRKEKTDDTDHVLAFIHAAKGHFPVGEVLAIGGSGSIEDTDGLLVDDLLLEQIIGNRRDGWHSLNSS